MTAISREVAANVLFHFRGEGFPGGGFTESLLLTFARADTENHAKLSMAFPAIGTAVLMAKDDPQGIHKLRAIFAGENV